MSDALDEERRAEFLQILHELRETQEIERREKESQKLAQVRVRSGEVTNGLSRKKPERPSSESRASHNKTTRDGSRAGSIQERPKKDAAVSEHSGQSVQTSSASHAAANMSHPRFQPPSKSQNDQKMQNFSRNPTPSYFYQLLHAFYSWQTFARRLWTTSPKASLRLLCSALIIILAFSNRDVRERCQRMFRNGWDKVRRTAGMGVRVSYM